MADHNRSISLFPSVSMPLQGLHLIYPVVFLFLFFILLFSACNESFEPWQENDQYHFSIYGVLDATVDTQWVRVMPVREDLFLASKPIEATVILEDLTKGESAVQNDSLFAFAHEIYAYNFWTTMTLHPEHSYRLTAEGSEEKTSQVQVTLPADFPPPMVRTDGAPHIGYIEDQDMLEILFGGTPRSIFHQQIFIVSAGPGFHHFPSIDEKIVVLPEGISNVQNGVGYLAGFVSKTVPYKPCYKPGTTDAERGIINLIPCELEPYPWSETIPVWDI